MFGKITIYLFLLILLVGCGGEIAESTNIPEQDTAVDTNTLTESSSSVTKETEETAATPLDITNLDVCTFIPRDKVATIVGSLRQAPETAEAVGDEERGCTYTTDEGFIYTITIMSLDRWETLMMVLQEPTAVPNLGDEAYTRDASGDLL